MSESCSIITKKYGELHFSKITGNLSDIVEKADNENIIPILMKENYSEELNTNFKKEDIDFHSFSEDEQKDFNHKFFAVQFRTVSEYMEAIKSTPKLEEVFNSIMGNTIVEQSVSTIKSMQTWSPMALVRKPVLPTFPAFHLQNLTMRIPPLIGKQMLPTFPVVPSCGIQMPEGLLQLTKMTEEIGKLAKVPSLFAENHFSSLSSALGSFSKLQGSYIARINEQGKTLSNQIGMLAKFGLISPEIKSTAISFFPDYTVSTIYRDEDNNVDVYAKNPEESDGAECNIKNVVQYKRFMETLNISRNEAMNFLGDLQEYPYLALATDVGKKIFEAVQTEIVKYVTKEKDNILYHARGKEKGKPDFTPIQMTEVLYGMPGMGRYNFVGQSRYYLTTDPETAKNEVECDEFPESTVLKLQQIQEMNVFDISSEDCPLASLCNMPKEVGNDYTAYLIPNFVAICCAYLNKSKRHSVDAIKYKSNKNGNGYCYVILDRTPLEFFDDGEILFE